MSVVAVDEWATRHLEEDGAGWAAHYWDSWRAPHRQQIVRVLQELVPDWQTLHEVGCGPGANLRLLTATWPERRLSGWDANPEAVRWCQEHLADVPVWEARLPEASLPASDVLLSCYALAYVAPDALWALLDRLWAAAARALLLAEPMAEPEAVGACGPRGEWRHDYAEWAQRAGGWTALHVRAVDPPADRMNRILVLRRRPAA